MDKAECNFRRKLRRQNYKTHEAAYAKARHAKMRSDRPEMWEAIKARHVLRRRAVKECDPDFLKRQNEAARARYWRDKANPERLVARRERDRIKATNRRNRKYRVRFLAEIAEECVLESQVPNTHQFRLAIIAACCAETKRRRDSIAAAIDLRRNERVNRLAAKAALRKHVTTERNALDLDCQIVQTGSVEVKPILVLHTIKARNRCIVPMPKEERVRRQKKANAIQHQIKMQDLGFRERRRIRTLAANRKLAQSGYFTNYVRKRRAECPEFKLADNYRRRINGVLRKGWQGVETMKLLGCSFTELRRHIESQFESWMNWANYGNGVGKWVVDHVRPCASYDLSKESEQRACFNFKNLKPVCFIANSQKSSRWLNRHWHHGDQCHRSSTFTPMAALLPRSSVTGLTSSVAAQ